MPLCYSIPVFLGSLALVVGGSVFLSRALGRLGRRLEISEQFLGFLTALGADSPEIASAVVAMLSGQTDVGVGVVFGSNLFNLASLLGLTALMAGRISVTRKTAILNGAVGVLVTGIAVALVLGIAAPALALGLELALLAPYTSLLAMPRSAIENLPLPAAWRNFLAAAAGESREHGREIEATASEKDDRRRNEADDAGTAALYFRVFGVLLAIVAGSVGLVRATTWLTTGWLAPGLLGTLVLAILTGIPNLYTAARLALRNRGSAVITEAMNSNSLNIVVGLAIPGLIFGGVGAHTAGGYLDTGWLMLLTVAVAVMLAACRGLNRLQGGGIIAAYLVFVALRVYLS